MALEVALVVYTPGLGLVMAETMGACAVSEPATAKPVAISETAMPCQADFS
jgi:hypothetical protein